MKNKTFLAALVVVLGGFGWWLWSIRSSLPIDEVMPSPAIFYVRINHVEKHVQEALRSDFAKNLMAIDVSEVLAHNHFSPKDIHDFEEWQKGIKNIWANPLIRKSLSREVAIGSFKKDGRHQIVMSLRLTFLAKTAEFLGQLFGHWPEDVSFERQHYHGAVINHVVLKKRRFAFFYTRLRDLLILAPEGYGCLEDVVDVYQHRQSPLAANPQFLFVKRKAYPKADALIFVNTDLVFDWLRKALDAPLETQGALGKKSGFPVYGLSYLPGVVSKYKMIAPLNAAMVSTALQKRLGCGAVEKDALKLVPTTAIAYHWDGCYDVLDYWKSLEKRLPVNSPWTKLVHKIKNGLEKRFTINIRQDVLPILGNEMGGYLTDVDLQGKYPFPRLLVFAKVKDRAAIQRLLAKFQSSGLGAFQREDYHGIPIYYIRLSLGANMDIGYCFIGDYLCVASSRQLLKLSLDAYGNALRSLISDDMVKRFSLDTPAKFHAVTLMKTAEVARRAQDFVQWVNKYLSSQVSLAAVVKQDGASKAEALDQAIADKKEELTLAEKKLSQLRSKTMGDVSDEDALLIAGTIAHLRREEEALREDILTYKVQKERLYQEIDSYMSISKNDKLMMFNMESVVAPVLKGLESIDAEAVVVRLNEKTWETEILLQ